MRYLKIATAVDLPIGPFLDSLDGVTAKTALTITQPDVRLKKGAANWAQKAAAQTLTHEENGFYEVTIDATDTDTAGPMRLAVFKATACPIWEDFTVLTAEVYDSLFGASAAVLSATALANIKTQAVAALNTDTYAEPGQGAPAATTTLVGKIGYLYKAWRNKSTQTASQYSLFADDTTTVDQKASFADDATTATRGEMATGA